MIVTIYALLSAIFHPLRDLVLKGKEPRYDLYLLAVAGWVPIAGIQTLITQSSWQMADLTFYYCILSAFGNLLYYAGIAFALKKGDISVYFPIFRSSPFLIAFVNYILWDTTYKPYFLIGIALIIFGVIVIYNGWTVIKKGSFRKENKSSILFALMALLGSVIYFIADARAMQVPAEIKPAPSTYLFYNLLFCTLLFFIIGFGASKSKLRYIPNLFIIYKKNAVRLLTASITDYISYFLILLAESMNGDMVLVNSLRLWDIPISVILAKFILKEKNIMSRLTATGFILAGSILVTIYK